MPASTHRLPSSGKPSAGRLSKPQPTAAGPNLAAFRLKALAGSPQASFEMFLVLISATAFQIMQWKYDWECNGIYTYVILGVMTFGHVVLVP